MKPQLNDAWPVHTYPHLHILPDGGVAVSSGKTLAKYTRPNPRDPTTFKKVWSWPDRPGAPWCAGHLPGCGAGPWCRAVAQSRRSQLPWCCGASP